ncbi:HlyD family efflux transporter periplasmic adaptor subunit [Leptospira kanakyensis]|uniref:HlyD family efflux transporter periplasmic adaptor subunit n=1 Tax=Leptospira kanakyensis TaxID=2484968 RepID=A0A6N4Q8B0_9LEPT|nr:biotin/lipoyl-binding protein [Leptospira kanakyensis]TGK47902.1 HlyD family efflux transporter periplasmic adaptor subunit [Leptospira kanakyensis]TGK63090.1 HlyD family efflux transporter periplasmic adaptor subunit [Leptospira kanakyensis]TGK66696.1 HlyD family efflux transporter periplasmic adaptor subunit [Leptospira kanakyensis]
MKFQYLSKSNVKSWVQKVFILGVLYFFFSIVYTFFSTEELRARFPLFVKLFYFQNEWGNTTDVFAMEAPKQGFVYSRPRSIEENKVIEFPAVVEPTKEIQLHQKQSGRVKKIYVDEGNTVKEGQVLLEIDDELFRLEGERLRLSLEIAGSQVAIALEKWKHAEKQFDVKLREIDKKTEWIALAEKEWSLSRNVTEKKTILWKQGFVSLSELEKLKQEEESKETQYKNLLRDRDNLLSGVNLDLGQEGLSFEDKLKNWREKNTSLERSEYELSLSQQKIIKNQIKTNGELLAETKLRSPKSGKILKIQIKEGEMVNQNPVMTLMEKGELSIGFQIGESDLVHFSPGKSVLFLFSDESIPPINGKVDRVGGFLDPRSHSIGIKVRLDLNQSKVLPGMFGLVQVKLPETKEKLLISKLSLRGDESSGFYVNVKQGERIEKRFIQFKPYLLGEIEVLAGLSSEDQVESSISL